MIEITVPSPIGESEYLWGKIGEGRELGQKYLENNNIVETEYDWFSWDEEFVGNIYYGTDYARCEFNADDDIKKHVLKVSGIISKHIHKGE